MDVAIRTKITGANAPRRSVFEVVLSHQPVIVLSFCAVMRPSF